ncbi:MAG: UPF0182 family protein [Gemmatimonadetes bacterium]|nr:UPF0182 family protein [Gemmatimonadota bacterium]
MKPFLRSLRGGRLLVVVLVLIALLIALGRLASDVVTEVLWQTQAGYLGIFWRRVLWQWGARVLAGVAVGLMVFFDLRAVAGTLGGIQIKRRFGNIEISEQLPHGYVSAIIGGGAALLALWFGAAVPESVGSQGLLLAHAAPWGAQEPILGRDVAFYVFWLPMLRSVVGYAQVVVFLLFTLATAGYAATGAVRWGSRGVVSQRVARLHLGGLMAAFLVLLAMHLWLGRYELLLNGSSHVQGIFGYADAEARLPALQTMVVIALAAAAAVAWGSWRNRGVLVVTALVGLLAGALLIDGFYPAMVQRFRVEPNELARETPYIEANLKSTRVGFGLEGMERRRFQYDANEEVDWTAASRQFRGLPVWNQSTLLTTYRQLEARFPYYDFSEVTIDRYGTPSGPVPVAVSVREIDPNGIQDPNWQNLHLRQRYVEGMGAVASLAAERTAEGRPPMIVSGIPPEFTGDSLVAPHLTMQHPEIFFGSRPQLHAVVSPSAIPEGAATDSASMAALFPEGIQLSSTFRKLALAWRFQDPNLLFTSEITSRSRFIYRRRVVDRAAAIAPFLRYPESPYPVIADGRIVWILEGFTATRDFPLSTAQPMQLQLRRPVNYVRNSVKITVDAITGEVDFYRVPIADPLADAYARAFPGLFKPLADMPPELRVHLRYSRELMNLQARVLLQYHQETAPAFHGQQDVWSIPGELAQGTTPVPYRPEYGIYELPGEDTPHFNLTTVFVPANRQNLTAILVARLDAGGEPRLILYDVGVEDQVQGPRQIESLVEQDPQISQQLSLWRTGGSEVWTGHLHLVPVGSRLLYMEPVFLAADADAIPELRRYVVSDGRRVTMNDELAGAIGALESTPGATEGEVAGEGKVSTATDRWPAAALDILNQAESRLKAGDWKGFGESLDRLRTLLEKIGGAGGAPSAGASTPGGR